MCARLLSTALLLHFWRKSPEAFKLDSPRSLWRIRAANWILLRVHQELGITAKESAGLNRGRLEEMGEGHGGAQQVPPCREKAVGKTRKSNPNKWHKTS